MSLLTVNGIELPIARDSFKRGEIEIGASGRAFSGVAWKSIRSVKRTASLTTAPMSLADADAWSALLNGRAVNWDFEVDTYSLQGHAATVANGAARSTTLKKFGAASLNVPATSGAYAEWSIGLGSSWTIAFWHDFAGWAHVVKTSAGTTYVNGVASGASYPGTVTSGVLRFAYSSSWFYVDDAFALPAVVPASWPAQMYAHAAQLVAAPSLTVAGDLLGGSVIMQARAVEREPLEYSGGVLWRLSVEMEEA